MDTMQFLRSSSVAIAFLLCAASVAEPNDLPRGHATLLSQAPTLDGNVADDPAWDGLAPFTGFTQLQPDNGAPASQRTEVYFGFTEDALHVGVICFETDTGAITVSNDGVQSDSFSMVLDTFGTGLQRLHGGAAEPEPKQPVVRRVDRHGPALTRVQQTDGRPRRQLRARTKRPAARHRRADSNPRCRQRRPRRFVLRRLQLDRVEP